MKRALENSKRPRDWAKMGAIFSGLVLCVAQNLSAQEPAPLVTVAGKVIPEATVLEAARACRQNAPDLSAGACLDRYWVPRWLLDERASEDKLEEAQALVGVRRALLSTRLLETIDEKTSRPSDKEISSYLEAHARDFEKPLRIRIFRILVASEDEARKLLAKLDETVTLADFRTLCREHSLDRATGERGGDLGFVWPDGSTDIPQVSAETSLYEAAMSLKDGEFSPVPVPEGKHFAVLWRRGSLPAESMSERSRDVARLRWSEKKAEEAVAALLTRLSKDVSHRDDELLGKLRRPEATLFREP